MALTSAVKGDYFWKNNHLSSLALFHSGHLLVLKSQPERCFLRENCFLNWWLVSSFYDPDLVSCIQIVILRFGYFVILTLCPI